MRKAMSRSASRPTCEDGIAKGVVRARRQYTCRGRTEDILSKRVEEGDRVVVGWEVGRKEKLVDYMR